MGLTRPTALEAKPASPPRFAYLALPALRLELARQRRPELAGRPLALWEARGNRAVLVACSVEAWTAGVRAGMTRPEARALCHELETLPVDPPAALAALEALAEQALALSPLVSPDAPHGLFVEASSSAHLFGGEPGLLAALRVLGAGSGHATRAAVSDGPRLARLVARHSRHDVRVVPPGRGAHEVAGLPLAVLELGAELGRRLRLLGLETLGDLARLPVATLPRRFGDEGVAWARLARGDDPFVPPAFVPGGLVVEALELEAPLDTLEPLLFALKRLLDRVELRLRARGAATTRLLVRLALDDGSQARREYDLRACSVVVGRGGPSPAPRPQPSQAATARTSPHPAVRLPASCPQARLFSASLSAREVEVVLAHPFRAAGSLLRIARARLQTEVLAAPVIGLAVTVLEEAPFREASADLFRRGGTQEEGVAELIARLSAALGEPAVFAARRRDVHRPEDAWEKIPYSLVTRHSGEGPCNEPERPLRLFDAPEPVGWSGDHLQWRGRSWQVAAFAGPERLQGEWWLEDVLDRDYYTLELGGGERLWLFEDTQGEFHVHGVFE